MAFENEPIRKLSLSFERRAKAQRTFAQRIILVIIAVVALTIFAFYYAPLIAGSVSPDPTPLSNDSAVLVQHYQYVAQKEMSRMVATLAVRVSVTVTLLFFVQILWGLYRYYTRLSTFYGSRADSLELVLSRLHRDDGLPSVSDLVLLFTPTLDFGKSPASMSQAAVDLAKTIIDSTKSSR